MTATGWDKGLTGSDGGSDDGAAGRGLPELLAAAPPKTPVLGTWEDWLSFALLAATQIAFALSIARADWVGEMPSLPVVAVLGLVAGSALARVPFRTLPLFVAGIGLGFAVAVGMVMQAMELSDPLGPTGLATRWSELWARMGDWVDALIFGGVSSDPLPFVLLMVVIVWLLPYIAGWAVFRWQNPWLALIPAGIGILTNISYLEGQPSIEFILFLFAAILLFTRLQLLRTVRRWRGQQAALPQLLSLEVLHAGAWVGVGLILVAWLIPAGNEFGAASSSWERAIQPLTDRIDRFGQVFIGIDSKRSQLIHHFDDALPLQGRVRLTQDPLFIVALPQGEVPQLRSGVFDEYSREGWRLTDSSRDPLPGTTIEAASFGTPETREQLRRPVVVEVLVAEGLSDRRLLSVGDPLAADRGAELLTAAAGADLVGLRPSERIESGDSYVTVGTISAADVEILVAAGTVYPDWVSERYLQLPDSLPQRVRDLATEVAGATDIPYVAAFQIERYLRTNYAFTLRVEDPPPRRDAVDFFLFDSRRGYFDHHASAMAVLLRSLGIPARVAVGFSIDSGAFDEESQTYLLTEEDSWAWPEVYFPGLGWVEFNPTPLRATISRPGPEVFGLGADDVPALGASDDELLLTQPGAATDDSELLLDSGTDDLAGSGGSTDYTVPLLWLLAFAAAASALYLVARVGWAYPYRNLAPATARWAKVQRLSGWAGVRADPQRTPIEAAAALQRDLEAQERVELLARSFTRERYGGAAAAAAPAGADSDPTRLDALYRRVRNRLFRETLLRRLGIRRRSH
ncbi:MAG: transglutaminase-like domain-containing protein [Chloroflexi bacterium]|nr:transglutaminase-like domain-containing protein [Chloroflexota bacterium]